jgi:hypothetical protein
MRFQDKSTNGGKPGSFLSQAGALRRESSGGIEGLLCHCSAFGLRRRLSAHLHRHRRCHHRRATPLAEIAPALVEGRDNVVDGAIRKP